jgi:hypothetical protein
MPKSVISTPKRFKQLREIMDWEKYWIPDKWRWSFPFIGNLEMTALLVEGSSARPEDLIIKVLLAGLILRYSRGSNSRADPRIFPVDLMMGLC